MLNQKAFDSALRTFNRMRGSSVACLRAAIYVFKAEEAYQNLSDFNGLSFSTADTDKGEDTALVISGFANIDAIHDFITDVVHATRK